MLFAYGGGDDNATILIKDRISYSRFSYSPVDHINLGRQEWPALKALCGVSTFRLKSRSQRRGETRAPLRFQIAVCRIRSLRALRLSMMNSRWLFISLRSNPRRVSRWKKEREGENSLISHTKKGNACVQMVLHKVCDKRSRARDAISTSPSYDARRSSPRRSVTAAKMASLHRKLLSETHSFFSLFFPPLSYPSYGRSHGRDCRLSRK